MKKIFTFLFFATIISSSFAQTDFYKWNETSRTDYKNNDTYQNIIWKRNQDIQKINDQIEYQVHQVIDDGNLNIWEKRDVLDRLETQRIQKINNVFAMYNNSIAYSRNIERGNAQER